MRIWFQGLVPRASQTEGYYASMERHVERIGVPDTTVAFHAFPADLYPAGSSPAVLTRHIAGELVEAASMAAFALEAEEKGFDAFAMATLQEPGLQAARTLVDIPVVGYGLAASLLARCLGSRIGIVAFNPVLLPLMKERLDAHVPGSVGPVSDLGASYEQVHAAFGGSALKETFEGACHALIADGADVIVPGQMVLAELAWSMGTLRFEDVPVIDALGAVLLLAADLHRLRTVSAVTPNRRGLYWSKPSGAAFDQISTFSRESMGLRARPLL
jgi:allantoin racemase